MDAEFFEFDAEATKAKYPVISGKVIDLIDLFAQLGALLFHLISMATKEE